MLEIIIELAICLAIFIFICNLPVANIILLFGFGLIGYRYYDGLSGWLMQGNHVLYVVMLPFILVCIINIYRWQKGETKDVPYKKVYRPEETQCCWLSDFHEPL